MVRYINGIKDNADVENVMSMINNYVNYNDSNYLLNDFREGVLEELVEQCQESALDINGNYVLGAYPDLYSGGRFVRLKLFFKKSVRKTISWYLRDICKEQTEINARIVRMLNDQVALNQALVMQNNHLRECVTELQEKINGSSTLEE